MMHTKGPLAVTKGKPRKITAQGVLICTAVLRDRGTTKQNKNGKSEEEAEANARRLAACWNALEGFDIAAIEAGVVKQLVEAIQGLGAMPEGFCFCHENRIGDDSKVHYPECRDLRNTLALIAPSQELQEQA